MAIIDVVKYDGGNSLLVWKHPVDELGTWTQLVVNESQEAVLFKGGKACDVFGPGRHTLSTQNIPILNKIVNLPFGGDSPFKAEVWFVNKLITLDVKWGTSSPIQLLDPKFKIFAPVRAFGQFGIKIDDAKKFLVKLVGTCSSFDMDTLVKYFRGFYLTKVKDVISTYLVKEQVSVLEINAYLEELSAVIKDKMTGEFEPYGIELISFNINDINVPEDDEGVMKIKEALAKRAEMDIVGYSYQQERSFDTLESAASNPGSSQGAFMGAGIGLGMGLGMGKEFSNQTFGIAGNLNVNPQKPCPKCGALNDQNVKFCSSCGQSLAPVGEVCPKCNSAIKPGSKFCPECGASLVQKCANCGAELNANSKFCPECGTKRGE